MGRIKSTMVKRASFELLKRDLPFTEKFEDNKKLLGNEMPSKKVRNKIAGYLARLVKVKNKEGDSN
tara:strand:- start:254 stop:451 length:198 start_codon:yes stop_codon:yes gene_type:complete